MNNLTDDIRYRIGNAARGKHWFNNGLIEKYDYECPIGFKKGRLPQSEETKKKIGAASKGRIFSAESRKKISLSKIGANNPQYGKQGTIKGKIAICKQYMKIVKYIFPEELKYYEALGFKKGNLRRKKL